MSELGSHVPPKQNETTNTSYTVFLLIAFPGFQESRFRLAIPFFCIYLMILIANSALIYVIAVEDSLHSPMYILIALLLAGSIFGTTTVLPKMLLSLLYESSTITLTGCLLQMFFLYLAIMLDVSILLMMALDRYVAICHPLHYIDIMTNKLLVLLMVAALFRSLCVVCPVVILASGVRFCRSNIIGHFACEHMALMKLACGDTTRNRIVGMCVRSISVIFDLTFLGMSYSKIIQTALNLASGSMRHKAFHTCSTHFIVLFVGYTCSIASSIVFRVAKSATQDVHNLLSMMYLLFPWAINPIIYGMRTKEIKESLLKLIQRKRALFISKKPGT